MWECSFEQKEDDTISRQAAIDAVCGWCQADCTPCEFFPCGEIKAIQALPPAQPNLQPTCNQLATDTIDRQAAIDAILREYNADDSDFPTDYQQGLSTAKMIIEQVPSAQPERLTDDDWETIRIHLNAYKEKLCNLHRWEEAEEYQRIINRFMSFASAQAEHIRINLNEPIKVKLTAWGKEIYYHQYDRVNKYVGREVCKPKYPTEDENGYTEFQLWCFMELYGEHMGMTLPNVIEPLEIVYER